MDEIVIVATRSPVPLSSVGNSVTVLNAAAILQSQAVQVADLLAQTPGINFARNGGAGELTSVFIRGADSDETLVLIDGVVLNDPSTTTGGFFFSNLLTADIARIEILRGSNSTLYGSQAMGGVINVITAEPAVPFGGGFTAEAGSHDTGYVTGNVGGKSDSLLWRLSGNWYGTGGIPAFDETFGGKRPSAGQIGGGNGQLKYDLTPDVRLDVRGYYTTARTDTDGYDTPTGNFGDDGEFADNDQFVGYTGLTLSSPDRTFINRLALQYTDSETREYDPRAPFSPFAVNADTETFYGIGRNTREEYQGTWEMTPRAEAVFGAQHERSTISTDTPAYDLTPAPLEEYATIDSAYLQLRDEIFTGFTLTGGGRYDHHDVFGGHSTGQVAAAWALNDGQTILRASFGQGFKAPSLYQLYSVYGNTALRPEQSDGWDAGIEHHAMDGRLTLSAAYFERDSRDLIDFFFCAGVSGDPACLPGLYGYYANILRAAAHGVELQGVFRPVAALSLAANYTYTDSENRSAGSADFGKLLARRPTQMANASATVATLSGLTASVAARFAGRAFDDATNDIALGGYVLVDLRIAYPLRERLEVYARLENATDKHYETAYEYGTLGRSGYAGVRVTF